MAQETARSEEAGAARLREVHHAGKLLGMQYAFGISVSDAALPLARLLKRSQADGDLSASTLPEALRQWESEGGRLG